MPSQAVLELLVELKDQASSGLASLGGVLKTVGGIAGGVALAGVAAFGAAVVSGVGDAREANQIMAQTEAVIKSTGGAAGFTADQIADMAGQLSAASGQSLFGDDDIQQGQNLLLTFTNIKETLPDATKTMVDLAQAMGTDVKGGAIQLGKALNDPIAGISALSRVGVTFDEKQKAVIKRLQESGDVAGAQKIILAELNKEFGGSAAAAAAADGGWAQFNDRMGEAKETLGAAVLPLMGMLVGVLNDRVLPVVEAGAQAFANLVAAFQTGAESGGGFIGGLTNALYSLDTISPIFDVIGDSIVDLAQSFDEGGLIGLFDNLFLIVTGLPGPFNALAPILDGIAAAFSDGGLQGGIQFLIDKLAEISPGFALLKGVVEAALPPIQEIVLSVFGIISGFIEEHGAKILADLTSVWQQIQSLIAAVLPPIQSVVATVFGAIAAFLAANGDDIQAFLGQTWDQIASIIKIAVELIQAIVVPIFTFIASFIAAHGEEIQALLGAAWTAVKAIIDGALTIIQGVLKAALQLIQGDWEGAWETIKTAAARVWEDIKQLIGAALDELNILFGSFVNDAIAFGANMITGIVQGVKDNAAQLYSTLKNLASDALAAAKAAIHIGSPSKDFADQVGEPIIDGIIAGVSGALPALDSLITGTATALVTTMQTTIARGDSALRSAFQGIVEKAQDATGDIKDAFTGSDIGSALTQLGADVLAGFGQGLMDGIGDVIDVINSTADTVEEAFNDAFDAHSPARRTMPVGAFVIQGIIEGMTNTWPDLLDAIGSLGDDLIETAQKIGDTAQKALSSAFGATASIDRQMAANLDKLADIHDQFNRDYIAQSLEAYQKTAETFADPKAGAQYFKMMSDALFETQKIRDQIAEASSEDEKKRLEEQLILISRAQEAEQAAFLAAQEGATSPLQAIASQIQTLIASMSGTPLSDVQYQAYEQLIALYDQIMNASRRAMGGPVTANQPYWVGERGPELFTPNQSGAIVANGAAGVTFNNVFNLPPGTTQQIADAVIAKLNSQMKGRR